MVSNKCPLITITFSDRKHYANHVATFTKQLILRMSWICANNRLITDISSSSSSWLSTTLSSIIKNYRPIKPTLGRIHGFYIGGHRSCEGSTSQKASFPLKKSTHSLIDDWGRGPWTMPPPLGNAPHQLCRRIRNNSLRFTLELCYYLNFKICRCYILATFVTGLQWRIQDFQR